MIWDHWEVNGITYNWVFRGHQFLMDIQRARTFFLNLQFQVCDIKGWLKPFGMIFFSETEGLATCFCLPCQGKGWAVCSAKLWCMNFSESPGNYIGPHTRSLWTPYHPCALSEMMNIQNREAQRKTRNCDRAWFPLLPHSLHLFHFYSKWTKHDRYRSPQFLLAIRNPLSFSLADQFRI